MDSTDRRLSEVILLPDEDSESVPKTTRPSRSTLAFVGRRGMRILTRPPEILYALSRHWFVILFCVATALFVGWKIAKMQPLVYLGTTKLKIAGVSRDRRTADQFLNLQTMILNSHSVLRNLFDDVDFSDKSEKRRASGLLARAREIEFRTIAALELKSPGGAETLGEAAQLQAAIQGFRGRSGVVPDSASGTITLEVVGVSHSRIHSLLCKWVDAYKRHTGDLKRETQDESVKRREAYLVYLERAVEKAREKLLRAEGESPQVNYGELEFLTDQADQLRSRRNELIRKVDDGLQPPNKSGALGSKNKKRPLSRPDSQIHALQADRNRYTRSLRELTIDGYNADSSDIKRLKRKLDDVESQLGILTKPPDGEEEVDVTQVETKLPEPAPEKGPDHQKMLASVRAQVYEKLMEKSHLTEKLDARRELKSNFERAQERRDEFKHLMEDVGNSGNVSGDVPIVVYDQPTVSASPYKYQPLLSIAICALAGLAFGIVVALFLEILCRKVRFKQDVIGDYELPVLGVIPKR